MGVYSYIVTSVKTPVYRSLSNSRITSIRSEPMYYCIRMLINPVPTINIVVGWVIPYDKTEGTYALFAFNAYIAVLILYLTSYKFLRRIAIYPLNHIAIFTHIISR